MKTFNVKEDQLLNDLAVKYVAGDEFAGEQFVKIMEPKMKSLAYNRYSGMDKEDLTQEFMLVSLEMCYKFVERYVGKANILPLIYTSCKNHLADLGRGDMAEKRSSKMKVGVDENGDAIYENREISLQMKIGEDGDSTMADKVSSRQMSVEDQVLQSFTQTSVEQVVKSFVSSTKGRNKEIVPLVYMSNKLDWSTEELNERIAEVLYNETGTEPNNDAIRQAKSRAVKALRKAIENGEVSLEC